MCHYPVRKCSEVTAKNIRFSWQQNTHIWCLKSCSKHSKDLLKSICFCCLSWEVVCTPSTTLHRYMTESAYVLHHFKNDIDLYETCRCNVFVVCRNLQWQHGDFLWHLGCFEAPLSPIWAVLSPSFNFLWSQQTLWCLISWFDEVFYIKSVTAVC